MVEYHVDMPNGSTRICNDAQQAQLLAVSIAMTGRTATIDVVCWTEEDAKAYGGDDAVKRYRDDPDASVFDRIEIRAESKGMVP